MPERRPNHGYLVAGVLYCCRCGAIHVAFSKGDVRIIHDGDDELEQPCATCHQPLKEGRVD